MLAADGERGADGETSVASAVGVVVHGVDTGSIVGQLHAIDDAAAEEKWDVVANGLDALLVGDLTSLVEESEGVYLRAQEAAILRLATLPEPALAAWRRLADPRARALTESVGRPGSVEVLERQARRLVMSAWGPQLMVALADARLRRGELAGAGRILEELLMLWPDGGIHTPLGGMGRAGVLSRLAGIHVALGDAASVRALREGATPQTLAVPSPRGGTVEEELLAAERTARAQSPSARLPGKLRPISELRLPGGGDLRISNLQDSREIIGTGAATRIDGAPVFLARVSDSDRIASRVLAVTAGPKTSSMAGASQLRPLWGWPSAEELQRWPRAAGNVPFAPVFVDDLAIFCWPSSREFASTDERHSVGDENPQDLIALSLTAEGRLEDGRGSAEERREDRDLGLVQLSFVGPPLVVGRRVYVNLIGRSSNGGGTELHLARFDVLPAGSPSRLRLRWRKRLVDGHAVPPQRYHANLHPELEGPLALPSGPAERLGYVYVGTNTGAVVCVDGDTGQPVWAETYERLGTQRARPVIEGDPSGWKYGPVRIDGNRVVVAPRDAELLLFYSALPLDERSTRLGRVKVRGGGTSTRKGSPLGDLLADEVAGVRDGVVWIAGRLPVRRGGAIRWPPGPLVAFRGEPDPRPGEPARRMLIPEIAELSAAGRPAMVGDSLLFPTFKALYQISLAEPEARPVTLYRLESERARRTIPDRLGNLVVDGPHVWSVTPSRLVLFGPADE